MSNLTEFVIDMVDGPVLTFYSGSISASAYLTKNGRLGFGDETTPSVDIAVLSVFAKTASYIKIDKIDAFTSTFDGVGPGGLITNNHFIAPSITTITDFTSTVSGTAAATSLISGEALHPGILQLSTGTTATGRAAFATNPAAIQFDNVATYIFEADVRIPVLSVSGSQQFTIYAGFGDGTAAGDMVDGAYFHYNALLSPNWQIKTSTNSVRTTATSSVVVPINSWNKLKVAVHGTGSAEFFIDDVSVGSLNTNLPIAAGRQTGVVFKIEKAVGITASTFHTDYCKLAMI